MGERVGHSGGARRVGLGRGGGVGWVDSEVGPGSRVGRVEVDKGRSPLEEREFTPYRTA